MKPLRAFRTCAVLIGAAVLAAAPAAAQLVARPILRFDGVAAGDQFGRTIARAGDVNGDGFADFLVGAPYSDGTQADMGRAYLFLGGARLDSIPDAIVIGRAPSAQAGTGVGGAGDVNGDGVGDWLVGIPNQVTGGGSGRVQLFHGGASADAVVDATFDAPSGQYLLQYGGNLTRAGDFNADGIDDFLIGALSGGFLHFGGPTLDRTPDLGLEPNPYYTLRAACAGDVNGDGRTDVAVTVNSRSEGGTGGLTVYFGGPNPNGVADVVFTTGAANDGIGRSVSSGGDVNGDGYDDLAVGAPDPIANGLPQAGRVLLFFGGPRFDGVPDRIYSGLAAGDQFGYSVAIEGDLDADGYADVVIGAPGADGAGIDAGRAYVFYGSPAADTAPDVVVEGETAGDQFGISVASPGDPDRAGRDAFLVGANQHDARGEGSGRVTLFRVSRFEVISPGPGDRWEAGGVGTLEWTGSDRVDIDLTLDDGAHWQPLVANAGGLASNRLEAPVPDAVSGRARLRFTRDQSAPGSGASSYSSSLRIVRIEPALTASLQEAPAIPGTSGLGGPIATGVDWDGDGNVDLVAGAPADADGVIAIRAESPTAETVTRVRRGETPLERFGAAVANVGDLDGDGWDDLAVGAPACAALGPETGRVYVFRCGPTGDGEPDWVFEGTREHELFGSSIASAGDVDGDQHPDFVVGAPSTGEAGRAYVFLGGQGFDGVADVVLTAGVAGPFGASVAGAGDVNGDGHADLLVSGLSYTGGTGSSAVHLYFGATDPNGWEQMWLRGDHAGDGFGEALAGLGDLDGDGFDDFAIGAPFANVAGTDAAGIARVYFGSNRFGPNPGLTLTGTEPGEQFGAAIAGRADLNGDGRLDFAVGAVGAAERGFESGRVDVFFSGDDAERDATLTGEPRTRFGAGLALRGLPGATSLGLLVVAAPFAAGDGALRRFDLVRWHFEAPDRPVAWLAGSSQPVRWRGAEPADLWFVGDTGTETLLAAGAGGAPLNAIEITLATSLPDSGRLELRPANLGLRGIARSDRVTLRRVVTLRRFEWESRGDGVALRWATDPPLGPGGLAGFRLWRLPAGGGPRVAVGGVLDDSSAVDPDGKIGDGYELVAVGTGGEQFVAGQLALPEAPVAIRVWPQPAGERGEVRIEFAAPRAAGSIAADLDVSIYDTRGRRVRRLAGGRPATQSGLVVLTWDGRTERGDRVGPGVYFLRARAPSAGFEKVRRVVMLDTPGR